MQITIEEFDLVTSRAFSFLISEFGYSVNPAKRGGYLGSALMREFVRDGLKIYFLFGDADASELCSITFDDGIDKKVHRHHMARNLSTLLLERLPEYRHKTRGDLIDESSITDVILEYGELLREYGVDAVKGDFSAFPVLVYMLIYVDGKPKNQDKGRPIGVFSTLELVEKAIINRYKQMGGHEYLNDYEIWRMEIDPDLLIHPQVFGLLGE